jgi:hypothetical protein
LPFLDRLLFFLAAIFSPSVKKDVEMLPCYPCD